MTTQESTENKPEVGNTSPSRTNLYEGIGMIIGLLALTLYFALPR